MWVVTATGKPADVRTSISKQFAAQTPATGAQETVRQSCITFIDGILALQNSQQLVTVTAKGAQGISHPDGGVQNQLTITIQHQATFPT